MSSDDVTLLFADDEIRNILDLKQILDKNTRFEYDVIKNALEQGVAVKQR